MNQNHPRFARGAGLACILASLTASTACTMQRDARSPTPIPALSADSPLDPDLAAARAIAVSPRVQAAAHRLEASGHRADLVGAPPDPSIALSLGVPIDGLGGFPISLSIMEGIGWLLNHDRIVDAAERERELAARELLAATVSVAAEARRLVRVLEAARAARLATDEASNMRGRMVEIDRAALGIDESNRARLAELESAANEARAMALAAGLEEHDIETALASLVAVDAIGAVRADEPAIAGLPGATTLEVVRARVRVARAEAMLAAIDSPIGTDARAGAAIGRDIEDRESVTGTIELSLPVFRRSHETAALRAEVDAERAELAEAERVARLEAIHALARAETARAMLELAERAAQAAEARKVIVDRARDEGEASLAEAAEAAATAAESRARSLLRRIEFIDAVAFLESRAAGAQEPVTEATR